MTARKVERKKPGLKKARKAITILKTLINTTTIQRLQTLQEFTPWSVFLMFQKIKVHPKIHPKFTPLLF